MKSLSGKIIITMLIFIISIFMVGNINAAEPEYTIKLSHGVPESDPTHIGASKFADLVEEYSDGKIEVEIYPNNVLGGEQEVFEAVQRGSIQMEDIFTGNMQPFAPSVGITQLPYLFSNKEQAWDGLDALLPKLNERVIENANVRILGIFEKGYRVLSNSKRPVRTIDDLKGLKIRVSDTKIPIKTFDAWGQEPVPMAWNEVFSALQQGVIDGQENPYTALLSVKLYEVQEYVTRIRYNLWTGPLIISERFFQQLEPELQDVVVKAGREATDYMRQKNLEKEEEAKTALEEEHGMKLSGPPEDEEIWKERAQSIWPELYSDVGGEEWVKEALGVFRDAGVDVPTPEELEELENN